MPEPEPGTVANDVGTYYRANEVDDGPEALTHDGSGTVDNEHPRAQQWGNIPVELTEVPPTAQLTEGVTALVTLLLDA